jgi:hypothetical protein
MSKENKIARKFHCLLMNYQSLLFILIFIGGLAAWVPALKYYYPVLDDYWLLTFLDRGIGNFFWNHAQEKGSGRILGLFYISLMPEYIPLMILPVVVLLHLITAWCFGIFISKFINKQYAIFSSIIYACGPFGNQVLLWNAANFYALSSCCFWLTLYFLCNFMEQKKDFLKYFFILFLFSSVACLSVETLIFAFFICGPLVYILYEIKFNENIKLNLKIVLTILTPTLTTSWYLFTLKISGGAWKQSAFNLRSIISSIYYQYTNIRYYEPFLYTQNWRIFFIEMSLLNILITSVFILLFIMILYNISWIFHNNEYKNSFLRNFLIFFIACLFLLSCGAVHIFAGGYSLDSRKHYPFIPFLLFLFGSGLQVFHIFPKKLLHWKIFIALAFIISGAGSWMNIALYRYEARRSAKLIEYVARHDTQRGFGMDISANTTLWEIANKAYYPQIKQFIQGVNCFDYPYEVENTSSISSWWPNSSALWGFAAQPTIPGGTPLRYAQDFQTWTTQKK